MRHPRICALLLTAVFCTQCGEPPVPVDTNPAPAQYGSSESESDEAAIPTFEVQEGWKEEPPANSMRHRQYVLPAVEGDTRDASLVVFYVQGGMGPVETNFDRWANQLVQPDGSNSRDKASTAVERRGNYTFSTMEVSGNFQAPDPPGSDNMVNLPDQVMLGCIIEGPIGPYYLKLLGPRKTVEHWRASYQNFLKTII